MLTFAAWESRFGSLWDEFATELGKKKCSVNVVLVVLVLWRFGKSAANTKAALT